MRLALLLTLGVLALPAPLAVADAAPVAVASTPYAERNLHQPVTFDGSASYDPETLPLSYAWRDSVTSEVLSNAPTFTLAFTDEGPKCLTLEVEDAGGATDEDEVCVSIVPLLTVTVDTADEYRMTRSTSILVRVRDTNDLPVAGAEVEVNVRYRSGDDALDVLLDEIGCARWTGYETTMASGNAVARPPRTYCAGGSDLLQLPTDQFAGVYEIHALACWPSCEPGGNVGQGVDAYAVRTAV